MPVAASTFLQAQKPSGTQADASCLTCHVSGSADAIHDALDASNWCQQYRTHYTVQHCHEPSNAATLVSASVVQTGLLVAHSNAKQDAKECCRKQLRLGLCYHACMDWVYWSSKHPTWPFGPNPPTYCRNPCRKVAEPATVPACIIAPVTGHGMQVTSVKQSKGHFSTAQPFLDKQELRGSRPWAPQPLPGPSCGVSVIRQPPPDQTPSPRVRCPVQQLQRTSLRSL